MTEQQTLTAAADGSDNRSGVMVALRVPDPDDYTVPGGLPAEDLHVTLAYLGKKDDLPPGADEAILAAVRAACQQATRIDARFPTEYGTFENPDEVPFWAKPEGPQIFTFRDAVVQQLNSRGLGDLIATNHPFNPHVTIKYLDGESERIPEGFTPREPRPIQFTEVLVSIGEDEQVIPLNNPTPAPVVAAARPRPTRINAQTEQSLRRMVELHNRTFRGALASVEMVKAVYSRGASTARSDAASSRHALGISRVSTFLNSLSSFDTSSPDKDLFPTRAPRTPLAEVTLTASAIGADEVCSLLTQASVTPAFDPRRAFYLNRALALTAASAPRVRTQLEDRIRAIVADGNSSVARSLRARRQLRDRYGRWIEMGGGVRFKVRQPGAPGGGQWYHGRVEGIDVPNGRVDVRLEDGRLVKVPNDKLEQPKAILNLPGQPVVPATDPENLDPDAPAIAQLDETDAPTHVAEGAPADAQEMADALDDANREFARRIDPDTNAGRAQGQATAAVARIGHEYSQGRIEREDALRQLADVANFADTRAANAEGLSDDERQAFRAYAEDVQDVIAAAQDDGAEVVARLPENPAAAPAPAAPRQPALAPEGVSPEEAYFNNGQEINRRLRSGDDADPLITQLDELMGSHDVGGETVYRGVTAWNPMARDRGEAGRAFIDALVPGAVVADPGFMSTSRSRDIAGEFNENLAGGDHPRVLMEIELPDGARGWDVDQSSNVDSDQQEVVLPRNGQLEILSSEEGDDGVRVVRARFTPASEVGDQAPTSAVPESVVDNVASEPAAPATEAPAPEAPADAAEGDLLPSPEDFQNLAVQAQNLADDYENKPEIQDRLNAFANAISNIGREFLDGNLAGDEVVQGLQNIDHAIDAMWGDTVVAQEIDSDVEDSVGDLQADIGALRQRVQDWVDAPDEPDAPSSLPKTSDQPEPVAEDYQSPDVQAEIDSAPADDGEGGPIDRLRIMADELDDLVAESYGNIGGGIQQVIDLHSDGEMTDLQFIEQLREAESAMGEIADDFDELEVDRRQMQLSDLIDEVQASLNRPQTPEAPAAEAPASEDTRRNALFDEVFPLHEEIMSRKFEVDEIAEKLGDAVVEARADVEDVEIDEDDPEPGVRQLRNALVDYRDALRDADPADGYAGYRDQLVTEAEGWINRLDNALSPAAQAPESDGAARRAQADELWGNWDDFVNNNRELLADEVVDEDGGSALDALDNLQRGVNNGVFTEEEAAGLLDEVIGNVTDEALLPGLQGLADGLHRLAGQPAPERAPGAPAAPGTDPWAGVEAPAAPQVGAWDNLNSFLDENRDLLAGIDANDEGQSYYDALESIVRDFDADNLSADEAATEIEALANTLRGDANEGVSNQLREIAAGIRGEEASAAPPIADAPAPADDPWAAPSAPAAEAPQYEPGQPFNPERAREFADHAAEQLRNVDNFIANQAAQEIDDFMADAEAHPEGFDYQDVGAQMAGFAQALGLIAEGNENPDEVAALRLAEDAVMNAANVFADAPAVETPAPRPVGLDMNDEQVGVNDWIELSDGRFGFIAGEADGEIEVTVTGGEDLYMRADDLAGVRKLTQAEVDNIPLDVMNRQATPEPEPAPSSSPALETPVPDGPVDSVGNPVPEGWQLGGERVVGGRQVQLYNFTSPDGQEYVVEVGEVRGRPTYVVYPRGRRRFEAANANDWAAVEQQVEAMHARELDRQVGDQQRRDLEAERRNEGEQRRAAEREAARVAHEDRVARGVDDQDRPLPEGWSREITDDGETVYRPADGNYIALNDGESIMLMRRGTNPAFAMVGSFGSWDELNSAMERDHADQVVGHREALANFGADFLDPATLDIIRNAQSAQEVRDQIEFDPTYQRMAAEYERNRGAEIRQAHQRANDDAFEQLQNLMQGLEDIPTIAPSEPAPANEAGPDVWRVNDEGRDFIDSLPLTSDEINAVRDFIAGFPDTIEGLPEANRARIAEDIRDALLQAQAEGDLSIDQHDVLNALADDIEGRPVVVSPDGGAPAERRPTQTPPEGFPDANPIAAEPAGVAPGDEGLAPWERDLLDENVDIPVAPEPAPDPLAGRPRPPRPPGAPADQRTRYHRDGVIRDRNGQEIYAGLRVRGQRDGQEGIVVAVQEEPAYARIEWPDGRRQVRAGRQLVNVDPREAGRVRVNAADGHRPAPEAPAPANPEAPAAPEIQPVNQLPDLAAMQQGLNEIREALPRRLGRAGAAGRALWEAGFAIERDVLPALQAGNMEEAARELARAANKLARGNRLDLSQRLREYVRQVQGNAPAQAPAPAQVPQAPGVDPSELANRIDNIVEMHRQGAQRGFPLVPAVGEARRKMEMAQTAAGQGDIPGAQRLIAQAIEGYNNGFNDRNITPALREDVQRRLAAAQELLQAIEANNVPGRPAAGQGDTPADAPIEPRDFVEDRFPNDQAPRAGNPNTPRVNDPRIENNEPGPVEPLNLEAQQRDFAAWGPRAAEIAGAARTRPSAASLFSLTGEPLKEAMRAAFGADNYGVEFGSGFKLRLISAQSDPNYISATFAILDANGQNAGSTTRVFYNDNGKMRAYNSLMEIKTASRGGGFATAFNRYMENWYIANGFDNVQVSAGLSHGGFVWAMNGFGWKGSPEAKQRQAAGFLRSAQRAASTDSERAQVEHLIARNNAGDTPTPLEVALIGWRPGMDAKNKRWLGKSILMGSGWGGEKKLTPENINQRQSIAYNFAKQAGDRIRNGMNKVGGSRDLAENIRNGFDDLRLKTEERQELAALIEGRKSIASMSPRAKRRVADWARLRLTSGGDSDYQGMTDDLINLRAAALADLRADYPEHSSIGVGAELQELRIRDLEANQTPGWNFRRLGHGEAGVNATWMATHTPSGQVFFVKNDTYGDAYAGRPGASRDAEQDVNNLFQEVGQAGVNAGMPSNVERHMIIHQRVGDNLDLVSRPTNAGNLSSRARREAFGNIGNIEDMVSMWVADGLGNNNDRHRNNYQLAQDRDGRWWVFPIDHGLFGGGIGWAGSDPVNFMKGLLRGDRAEIYSVGLKSAMARMSPAARERLLRNAISRYRDAINRGGWADPGFQANMNQQLDKVERGLPTIISALG